MSYNILHDLRKHEYLAYKRMIFKTNDNINKFRIT